MYKPTEPGKIALTVQTAKPVTMEIEVSGYKQEPKIMIKAPSEIAPCESGDAALEMAAQMQAVPKDPASLFSDADLAFVEAKRSPRWAPLTEEEEYFRWRGATEKWAAHRREVLDQIDPSIEVPGEGRTPRDMMVQEDKFRASIAQMSREDLEMVAYALLGVALTVPELREA